LFDTTDENLFKNGLNFKAYTESGSKFYYVPIEVNLCGNEKILQKIGL
jgi:hypothetical protein